MPLPAGLGVAGIRPRLGAWLLDLFFFGLLSLIPVLLAFATGAVGISAAAARQMDLNPYVQPTVPLLAVNDATLAAWSAVWVVLAIAYAAACWALFRGLPGQRLLKLQVADAATGRNLSPARAVWRALLVNGIPAAATAVMVVVACRMLATIVAADIGAASETSYLDATYTNVWGVVISGCGLASWAWPLLLLISVGASRDRRGIHDRLAGSMVVGRAPALVTWGNAHGHPAGIYGASYGHQYGQPPGPAGQPPILPPGYLWPQPPGADPAAGAAPPAGSESSADSPAPWPGFVETGAQQPASVSSAVEPQPVIRDVEPEARTPFVENRQVFGAKLPAGLRIAGYNRRVLAYVVDNVLVLVVFGAIAMALEGNSDPNSTPPPERMAMLAGLAAGVVQALYFVASWSIWRGTIGLKAVGMQVGEESTGHKLGPIDSLVRWALLQGPLALYLAVPYLLRPAVGILAIGWMWLLTYSARKDPDGRGYHDRLAHSLVVERKA
jgi:hypothetical protein